MHGAQRCAAAEIAEVVDFVVSLNVAGRSHEQVRDLRTPVQIS